MKKTSDLQLQNVLAISIFIFLFGLFSGLFFSTGLSEENNSYLSELFISSITDPSSNFLYTLLSSLVTNLTFVALMLAACLTKILFVVPFSLLWFKSFATGFCSGLVYLSGTDTPLLLSMIKLLPPSIFILPGFTVLAATTYIYSKNELFKSKRPSHEKRGLQNIALVSIAAITIGCIINSIVL